MTAKPRTLAQLAAHPWVESVSDERSSGDGIWVYTRPGFVNDAGGHTIHETTVKGCLAAFADIRECPEDAVAADPAPAVRPVLPDEQTPPPARSHGDAAPTLPELRAEFRTVTATAATVATAQRRSMNHRRPLHPMAEMLLMRLAATREPWLAVERLPLWDSLAEAGWIELWNRACDPGKTPWCECRITDAGRAALDARPSA